MGLNESDILYEDNHCLVVRKPAGVLTAGDATGDESMADRAREWIRLHCGKPGRVWLGIVHRLDRPVSGVLLLARTSKAASRLSDQFRRGQIAKTYLAVVEGCPRDDSRQLTNWLVKDTARNHVSVVGPDAPHGKKAVLKYEILSKGPQRSLLRVKPLTGRSHQIRVQLAHLGHPIAGDVRYGASDRLQHRILLHALSLTFTHPTRRTPITVTCEPPHGFSV